MRIKFILIFSSRDKTCISSSESYEISQALFFKSTRRKKSSSIVAISIIFSKNFDLSIVAIFLRWKPNIWSISLLKWQPDIHSWIHMVNQTIPLRWSAGNSLAVKASLLILSFGFCSLKIDNSSFLIVSLKTWIKPKYITG